MPLVMLVEPAVLEVKLHEEEVEALGALVVEMRAAVLVEVAVA